MVLPCCSKSGLKGKRKVKGVLDWRPNIWWLLQDTTVILLDVSQSMHKHLPETVRCIQSYLQQKVFTSPSVQVNNFVGKCRRTSLIGASRRFCMRMLLLVLILHTTIHTTRICVKSGASSNVYYSQLHPPLNGMSSGTFLKDADVKVE